MPSTIVTCPKCHQSFEYTYWVGISATAVRLGTHRYMKCRKCGKFALFDLHRAPEPVQQPK